MCNGLSIRYRGSYKDIINKDNSTNGKSEINEQIVPKTTICGNSGV